MTASEPELATLRRIETKVDGLDERLRRVEVTVAGQTAVDKERRWVLTTAIASGIGVAGLVVAVVTRL